MATPSDYDQVFSELKSLEGIVVGGQAVNFWASFYRQRCLELEDYVPFESRDLDIYGNIQLANKLSEKLGWRMLNHLQERIFCIATLIGPEEEILEILKSVHGLKAADLEMKVYTTRVTMDSKYEIPILTPIALLQAKLASWKDFDQTDKEGLQIRQDLKHLKISLLITHEFLRDLLEADENPEGSRSAIAHLNKVKAILSHEYGQEFMREYGPLWSKVFPIKHLKNSSKKRYRNFYENQIVPLL